MNLKCSKAPMYDEVDDPEVRETEIPRFKLYYKAYYGADTKLSDDDIINLFAYSEDDHEAYVWAEAMKAMEDGTFLASLVAEGVEADNE